MVKIYDGKPKIVKAFGRDLCIELETAFNKYYRLAEHHWGGGTPAFFYTEQRTKTFFTIALANLSSGLLLQEVGAERKKKKNARIDFYFRFHHSNFAMEVKQSWLHFHPKFNRVASSSVIKDQAAAIEQIKDLKKSDWDYDYALAVTFTPIYIRYKKRPTHEEVKECHAQAEKYFNKKYRKELMQTLQCHGFGIIPFSYLSDASFETYTGYQSYPFGILSLTCLK